MITLLDFYAEWCGPCQAMKPVLEKFSKEYEGRVEVKKVNVDENPSESQKFGIMSIPTLVLMKDGKEVDRRVGLLFEPVLKQWVESQLK